MMPGPQHAQREREQKAEILANVAAHQQHLLPCVASVAFKARLATLLQSTFDAQSAEAWRCWLRCGVTHAQGYRAPSLRAKALR